MSDIDDFREIADDILKEIKVTDELRNKTLNRCIKKRNTNITRIFVPVACLTLIISFLNIYSLLPLNLKNNKDSNQEINPLVSSDNSVEILIGQSNNNTSSLPNIDTKLETKTVDEIKKSFGDLFLIPSYIPDSFNLNKLQTSMIDENTLNKIVISYSSGEKTFLIIEEKISIRMEFLNFKVIDINGNKGYLNNNVFEDDNINTELHWFKNGVHYSIMGNITDNEAIKIAKSM